MTTKLDQLDRYDDKVLALHYEYVKGLASNNGDIEYYTSKISDPQAKVLEIGCGTGRITFPLKRNGIPVVGVDIAREMVAIAQRKAIEEHMDITLHVADGTKFNDGSKYDIVFVPFNSICFIPNSELTNFFDNLQRITSSAAKFLFDFTRPPTGTYRSTDETTAPWTEPLLLKEIASSVRWKMHTEAHPAKHSVDYVYVWEIQSQGKTSLKQSRMSFSSLTYEFYKHELQERGFKEVEVLKKPYIRDGDSEVHYFCEFEKA